MVIQLALDNLLCCLHYRVGNLRIDGAKFCIGPCRRLLDLTECPNKLAWETQVADREIKHCTLGASTIIGIYGNPHLAHRIAFNTGLIDSIGHKSESPLRA